MMYRWIIGLVFPLLVACAGDEIERNFSERSVPSLYNQAYDEMLSGSYRDAAPLFEEVERQHPYSKWASKSELMAAFCYYKINDYDDALVILNRFISLRPADQDIPYAYYLKGMSYYERVRDAQRDQKSTREALAIFQTLQARFPESRYAIGSRQKIKLLFNNLAEHEVVVGRFYQKRGYHLAAIYRLQAVVQKFSQTALIEESLYRLAESYLSLGLHVEARRAIAVLGYNYPKSVWYSDGYALLVEHQLVDEDALRYARRGVDLEEYAMIYSQGIQTPD